MTEIIGIVMCTGCQKVADFADGGSIDAYCRGCGARITKTELMGIIMSVKAAAANTKKER